MAPKRKRGKQPARKTPDASKRSRLEDEAQHNDPEEGKAQDGQVAIPVIEGEQPDAQPEFDQQGAEITQGNAPGTYSDEQRMRQIQREAYERFKTLHALAFSLTDDSLESDPFVETERLLDSNQVIVAIMAITEAVKWRVDPNDPGEEPQHFFDITTDIRLTLAKQDKSILTTHDDVHSLRPGRPLLIPWFYNADEQQAVSGLKSYSVKQLGRAAAAQDIGHRSHIFLLLIRMSCGLCEIRIYDSYILHFRSNPAMWPHVLESIHTVVRNMQWFPDGNVDSFRAADGSEPRFAPEVEVRVAHQDSEWACGTHTILNAWTVAMNLVPNPRFQQVLRDGIDFYDTAAQIINYAVAGLADSNLIYTFLVGHGFALPSKLCNQCPTFAELRTEHNINGIHELSAYVEDAHQMKEILQATAPNPASRLGNQGHGRHAQSAMASPGGGPGPRTQQAQARGHGTQAADSRSSGALIEPSVMANEMFLNPDCMSFWHAMNSTKEGRRHVQLDKFATEQSIHDFIEYYTWNLDKKGTKDLSSERKAAWFTNMRQCFDEALNFPAENVQLPTAMSERLLRLQLRFYRSLWQKRIITMQERLQLVQLYGIVARDLQTAQTGLQAAQTVQQQALQTPTAEEDEQAQDGGAQNVGSAGQEEEE